MICVYILRYENWESGVWKIGTTKNIDVRLKSYVTSNGRLPDTVLIKECELFRHEEKRYHSKFKLNKCSGQREHFILQNSDILHLQYEEHFRPYIGVINVSSVEEDLEILQNELQEKIQELQQSVKDKISQLNSEYNKKLNMIFKKKEMETMMIEDEIRKLEEKKKKEQEKQEKQQKKEKKEQENPLYEFLKLHSVYKKNNVVSMKLFRETFGTWCDKEIQKIDLQKLREFNSEYEIIKINSCKSCKKKHLKGCCVNYGRQTSTYIIKHMQLI